MTGGRNMGWRPNGRRRTIDGGGGTTVGAAGVTGLGIAAAGGSVGLDIAAMDGVFGGVAGRGIANVGDATGCAGTVPGAAIFGASGVCVWVCDFDCAELPMLEPDPFPLAPPVLPGDSLPPNKLLMSPPPAAGAGDNDVAPPVDM